MHTMANRLMLGTMLVSVLALSAPAQAATEKSLTFSDVVQAFLELFEGPEVGANIAVLAQQHNSHDDGSNGGGSPAPKGS
jgi:hypothetical protein